MIERDEKDAEGLALLTRRETARLLGVSVTTLERWAAGGHGPPHVKLAGSIRYPAPWLSEWVKAKAQVA